MDWLKKLCGSVADFVDTAVPWCVGHRTQAVVAAATVANAVAVFVPQAQPYAAMLNTVAPPAASVMAVAHIARAVGGAAGAKMTPDAAAAK